MGFYDQAMGLCPTAQAQALTVVALTGKATYIE
jgi:hypothetical protein